MSFNMTPQQELFDSTTANDQRGLPERAMIKVQHTMGGGILNPVVEHVGDLTHRMSEAVTYYNGGYESVADKVDKTLHWLTNDYGFEREMEGNIRNNSAHRGGSAADLREKVYEALKEYAKAHRKVRVHNRVQEAARDAAVAVGERDWNGAITNLRFLKRILDRGVKAWTEAAHEQWGGRVENPMWGYKAFGGGIVDPPIAWGWVRPNGQYVNGSTSYNASVATHNELARRRGLGKDWIEAISTGHVKFEIDHRGVLIIDAVKTPAAAKIVLKLAQRPEVNEVVLNWDRASDGTTLDYYRGPVDEAILRIRGAGRVENPRTRNGAYRHDSQSRDWGFLTPGGKVHSGLKHPDVTGHWDLARKISHGVYDAEELMSKGLIRFAVLRNGESLFDVWGPNTRTIKTGLSTVAKYLKSSPLVTGEVNLDMYWGDFGKPMWDKRYESPEAALRDIRKFSQLTPGELKAMIYDPTGQHRDYLEEKYEREENPGSIPKRPGEKDTRWPFKLIQRGDSYIVRMNDNERYLVTNHGNGWIWEKGGERSETYDTPEGALLNLEIEAESHTGRKGGTMKFIIYGPTARILGTVTAPNRRAARDVMRGSINLLKFKTAQDGMLMPYISSPPEAKYVADMGVQIK